MGAFHKLKEFEQGARNALGIDDKPRTELMNAVLDLVWQDVRDRPVGDHRAVFMGLVDDLQASGLEEMDIRVNRELEHCRSELIRMQQLAAVTPEIEVPLLDDNDTWVGEHIGGWV